MTDTRHLTACRNAWNYHKVCCNKCGMTIFAESMPKCEQGRILYDEYREAIKRAEG